MFPHQIRLDLRRALFESVRGPEQNLFIYLLIYWTSIYNQTYTGQDQQFARYTPQNKGLFFKRNVLIIFCLKNLIFASNWNKMSNFFC